MVGADAHADEDDEGGLVAVVFGAGGVQHKSPLFATVCIFSTRTPLPT